LSADVLVNYKYTNNSQSNKAEVSYNPYLPIDIPISEVTVEGQTYGVTTKNYIHGLPKKRLAKGETYVIPVRFNIPEFVKEYPNHYDVSHKLNFGGVRPNTTKLMYILPDQGKYKKIKVTIQPTKTCPLMLILMKTLKTINNL
jgi:hypothetical protein